MGRMDGWAFVRLFLYSFEYAYACVNTLRKSVAFRILVASKR